METKKIGLAYISTIIVLMTVSLVPINVVNAQNSEEESFTVNLQNADIHSFIEIVSKRTGKNFIVDPRVNSTVTVVSSEAIGKERLYQLFLSVLAVHGFAAVPSDSFVKIVPIANAVQNALPTTTDQPINGNELTTKVISDLTMSAQQIVEVIRPLLPQSASVSAEPFSNSVVITDRVANIERLIQIIRQIDNPN